MLRDEVKMVSLTSDLILYWGTGVWRHSRGFFDNSLLLVVLSEQFSTVWPLPLAPFATHWFFYLPPVTLPNFYFYPQPLPLRLAFPFAHRHAIYSYPAPHCTWVLPPEKVKEAAGHSVSPLPPLLLQYHHLCRGQHLRPCPLFLPRPRLWT